MIVGVLLILKYMLFRRGIGFQFIKKVNFVFDEDGNGGGMAIHECLMMKPKKKPFFYILRKETIITHSSFTRTRKKKRKPLTLLSLRLYAVILKYHT